METKYSLENNLDIYFSPGAKAYVLDLKNSKYLLDYSIIHETERLSGPNLVNKLSEKNPSIVSDLEKKNISLREIQSTVSNLKKAEEENFRRIAESNDL